MTNLAVKKQPNRHFQRYGIGAILLLGWLLGIITVNLVNDFNSKFILRSPIVFQSVIISRQTALSGSDTGKLSREATPSATLSPTPLPDIQAAPKPDRLKPQTNAAPPGTLSKI